MSPPARPDRFYDRRLTALFPGRPASPVRALNRRYEHLSDLLIRLPVLTHDTDIVADVAAADLASENRS